MTGERSVGPEATAIASITLLNQLISALIHKGILTTVEAAAVYEEAAIMNENAKTATNMDAAYLLRRSNEPAPTARS